ncbi:MAG: phospholipase B family protein, partial [Acidobacteriota bacterium]|nr:phospholipase B family protein [Acidobacteriota bacterium]
PAEIGFQHGYLLATEILEAQKITALELSHDTRKKWAFFRDSARTVLWPHIEAEYRDELQGIAQGLNTKGIKLDVWDMVALNASLEWSYFVKQFNKRHGVKSPATVTAPEHCSAFAATGSYTKDGKFVIGHNNWTGYLDGERWTVIFDVTPASGHRFLMDGFPGFIHSGDDFSVNAAGIVITETTISGFAGWDSNGIPEFVRARKAMQYSSSIDDFARIMKEGNNGGYANDWLVADRKTNEVASLELGLRNVNLQRTKDGYFVGSNFPIDPKLAREETDFKMNDSSNSPNARHVRWEQLMAQFKGKIDVDSGKKFLADHADTFAGKTEPNERTLCGHIDLSPRGVGGWQKAYGPAGAVQNKVTDSAMAGEMSFSASAGHSCGIDFKAAEHLQKHHEFKWQKGYLKDMDSRPWTVFQIAK